jgi:acyl-CoA thioester hydrolase
LSAFTWQVRVYWEDTDAGGIVYYANYLRFLERARSEWLRARGVSQRDLARDPGIIFSVVAIEAQYRRPARLEDLLVVGCEPRRDGAASIIFDQKVWRTATDGELLLTANVRVACLDAGSLKPRRVPEVILRELGAVFD